MKIEESPPGIEPNERPRGGAKFEGGASCGSRPVQEPSWSGTTGREGADAWRPLLNAIGCSHYQAALATSTWSRGWRSEIEELKSCVNRTFILVDFQHAIESRIRWGTSRNT